MFRFTIRELLLLTVVVAMAVAWWISNKNSVAQRAQLLRRNELLLDDIEQLKLDVELLKWKADWNEALTLERPERAEIQRREAIAKLRAQGYRFPREEK